MKSTLNQTELEAACRQLAQTDPDLGRILKLYGFPPLWAREKGFATLLQIILEQQVSLASARAAFDKLHHRIGVPTPARFLKLTDAELKQIGFSRQKTSYGRGLAERILSGDLDLPGLADQPDAGVRITLMKIKGIGTWTADIYLLMALLRPDVMPRGDLALHIAFQKLKELERRPDSEEFQKISQKWQPHRSAAARLLWHFYLSS